MSLSKKRKASVSLEEMSEDEEKDIGSDEEEMLSETNETDDESECGTESEEGEEEEDENENEVDERNEAKNKSEGIEKSSSSERNVKEDDDEEEEAYENDEKEKDSNVFPKSFMHMTASELRQKLGGPDGPAAIRAYFSPKDNLEHISEYLREGGSVQELVSQLALIDIWKNIAVNLFSAMGVVILKLMKEFPDSKKSLVEECKDFISNYMSQLAPMLDLKSSLDRKKSILKLLTAIASINDALALQILTALNLKKETIYFLAEHNNPLDESSIRVLFVKFLLSFMVGHSAKVVNKLCEKRYWIPLIFPGMKYDLFQTIELILTTLEEWLIVRKDVTKSSRLYVFSSKSLSHLASLYSWNPKSWKENAKNIKITIPDADPSELEKIRAKVHQLLLNLCTCIKTGVIFHDPKYGISSQIANNLVQQFIMGLSHPWEDKLKHELVSKTLLVCPDLIKPFCNSIASILSLPANLKWIKAMKFINEIIGQLEISQTFLENKTWLKIIYNVYAPEILLEAISNERLLTGTPEIRILCLETYFIILKNLKTINSLIKKQIIKNIFTTNLSNYLVKKAPNAEILLGCLKISLIDNNMTCSSIVLESIFTLDLIFPQLIDIVRYNKDCITMIRNYKATCKKSQLNKDICLMILKLIKLEVLLNPEIKDGIKNLKDIFNFADIENDESKTLSLEIIRSILENTGLFVNSPFELTLWVYLLADNFTSDIASILSKALKYANVHRHEIYNTILEAQENESEELVTEKVSLDDFINLSLKEENETSIIEGAENKQIEENIYHSELDLSPLLPAILTIVSQEDDKKLAYNLLASFIVHYMHTQVSVKAFNSLLTKYNCYVVEKTQHYLTEWNSPKTLKLSPFHNTVFSSISNYILLKSDEEPNSQINLEDKILVELCLNQCIFVILQLSLIGQALEENISRVINVVKYLMPMTTKLPLTHPQLVNNFHPIRNLEDSSNLTSLVTSIVENSTLTIPETILNSYTNRLFLELKLAKKSKYKLENCSNLPKLLLNFPLNESCVSQLIKIISSLKPKYFFIKNELTPWIHVLEYSLMKATEYGIIISEDNLSKICQIFYELHKANFNMPDVSKELHKYLVKSDITIGGNLVDQFSELFVGLCMSKHWYEEHSIYFMKLLGEEHNDFPTDIPLERAVILIASSDVKKKQYERLLSNRYNEILILLCAETVPSWLSHLANIVGSVMSHKTCDNLCKDINKMCDEIFISKDTLSFMKEIFYKSQQNLLFLNLLNQWLIDNSKKSDHTKSEEICRSFLEVAKPDLDLTQLQKIDIDVTKYLILHGLKLPSSLLLDQLTFYIKTYNIEPSTSTLLELIWSHSKFISLFIGNTDVKISLLKLIMVLFKTDRSLMKESYVPLLLSAYNASLVESDQLILEILQLFETSGINVNICKPFIWGESAIEHYTIKKNPKSAKDHPSLTLDLLNMDMINRTITNFPINRKFEGNCKFKFEDIYDPAFLLPVLNQLLNPEVDIKMNPWKIFHCGAAAITLASLSSNCSEIRSVACLVIQKIHAKYNGKTDATVWYHLIESIRRGLAEFGLKDKVPKISSIVSTFLARISLIIVDPTNDLYKQIQNFILARLTMNLKTIPALLEIFHSTEEHYRLHQLWILGVLRDGIRESSDLQLALNSSAFKFILYYHSCFLANREIKSLIEELVAKCLQYADKEKHFLIDNYGLIPWIESSGRSKIILEHLPKKLSSQYKVLLSFLCRDEDKLISENNELYQTDSKLPITV